MESVKVLLVDNNPTFLRITARFLAEEEWIDIQGCARSGQEALDMAPELDPDVILLDLNMPGIGGLEALPRLRHLLPETGIIALTLLDTAGYRQAALEAGADSFVAKAAMNQELIPTILSILDSANENAGSNNDPTLDAPTQVSNEDAGEPQ